MAMTLNAERLTAIWPSEPEMVTELLREAVATVSELISKLAYSIDSSNESARLAHEIKGLSLTVGAEEIAETSAEIEYLAKNGRTDESKSRVPTLRAAEQRLIDAVAAIA